MFSNSLRKNDVGARVEFTSKVMIDILVEKDT